MSTELKTDSWCRYMLYRKEALRADDGSDVLTSDDADTSTSLSDAQPFEYQPVPVSLDGVEQDAGNSGMPGNNQAQNKQFRSVVNSLGLDKDQAQQLHHDISGENLGYWEIVERAQDMFGN